MSAGDIRDRADVLKDAIEEWARRGKGLDPKKHSPDLRETALKVAALPLGCTEGDFNIATEGWSPLSLRCDMCWQEAPRVVEVIEEWGDAFEGDIAKVICEACARKVVAIFERSV